MHSALAHLPTDIHTYLVPTFKYNSRRLARCVSGGIPTFREFVFDYLRRTF